MNSTGRPSSPPLALTSSRQMLDRGLQHLAGRRAAAGEREADADLDRRAALGGCARKPDQAHQRCCGKRPQRIATSVHHRPPMRAVLPASSLLLPRVAVGVDQLAGLASSGGHTIGCALPSRNWSRLLGCAFWIWVQTWRVFDHSPSCREREVAGHGLEARLASCRRRACRDRGSWSRSPPAPASGRPRRRTAPRRSPAGRCRRRRLGAVALEEVGRAGDLRRRRPRQSSRRRSSRSRSARAAP